MKILKNEVRDDFGHECRYHSMKLWKQSRELTLNSLLQVAERKGQWL